MLIQDYFKNNKFSYVSPYIEKHFGGMEVDVNKTADLRVEVLKEATNEKTLVNKYQPEIILQETISFIESRNKPGWYIFLVRDKNDNLVWLCADRDAGGEWYVIVLGFGNADGWGAGGGLVLRNQSLDTSDPQSL